jgi:FSR family fosmidomycin resistance protein-like MFS transporter
MMAAFKTNKINDPKGASSESTVLPILIAISISHLINDSLQSLIPASYPIIKESFQLNFPRSGW